MANLIENAKREIDSLLQNACAAAWFPLPMYVDGADHV